MGSVDGFLTMTDGQRHCHGTPNEERPALLVGTTASGLDVQLLQLLQLDLKSTQPVGTGSMLLDIYQV